MLGKIQIQYCSIHAIISNCIAIDERALTSVFRNKGFVEGFLSVCQSIEKLN